PLYTLGAYLPIPTQYYESVKIEVVKIFGEEVVSGRTPFIANFSLRGNNNLYELDDVFIAGYIYNDTKMHLDPLILTGRNPFLFAPLFTNNKMNWTDFEVSFNNYKVLTKIYRTHGLQNGFELYMQYFEMNITIIHEYNETGFITEYIVYYDDQLYHNCSLGGITDPPIVIDTDPPVITVINPNLDDVFGTNPPEYHVTVEEEKLNCTWYRISNGSLELSEKIGFSSGSSIVELTGQINESLWNSFSDGNLTVRFYANDSA
ncbi:unnamed protein product, partial [marine sediment metagenome]